MAETCETCGAEALEPKPAEPVVYARYPFYGTDVPPALVSAAKRRNGLDALALALDHDPPGSATPSEMALRIAELGVTGYHAFAKLRAAWTSAPYAWGTAEAKRVVEKAGRPDADLPRAVALVERARAVAMMATANGPDSPAASPSLPAPVKLEYEGGAAKMRERLGKAWIAVLAEHDPPHHAINTGWTRFTERRASLEVSSDASGKDAVYREDVRYVLEGRRGAPIAVLLHGHSSKIEELEDVIPKLTDRFQVLVFDMPGGAGFTRGDLPPPSDGKVGAAVRFLVDFVMAFVALLRERGELGADVPVHFAGGSLGGNLAMRLSARTPAIPGAGRFAAWSPGSGWYHPRDPDGNTSNPWMIFGWGTAEERAARTSAASAKYDWADYYKMSTLVLTIAGQPILKPQAEHWYWEKWYPALRKRYIHEIYEARREIYCDDFRIMHWQIAWEQMAFSHHGFAGNAQQPYHAYVAPLLLMAGCNDNMFPERMASATHDLYMSMRAAGMTNAEWRGFCDSGHSLHNERPAELASVLATWFEHGRVV